MSWMTWIKYTGIVDDIPRNLFSTHFQFNTTPRPLHSASTWFDLSDSGWGGEAGARTQADT